MEEQQLKEIWKKEESIAHIHGWDFSHINGRYAEENDLPWNYKEIIKKYLNNNMMLLDYDLSASNSIFKSDSFIIKSPI